MSASQEIADVPRRSPMTYRPILASNL